MKKTLHLNLKRKWFDMILSREKKEEYREIKAFWCNKFIVYSGKIQPFCWWGSNPRVKTNLMPLIHSGELSDNLLVFDGYNTITFSNGYSKNRDQFEIELKRIRIDTGKTEWGAEENEKYFILELGDIVESNVKQTETTLKPL